jgi:hypothetical protein
VAVSAFLILSARNTPKHGDLRTRAPQCDQFCN